MQLAGSGSGLIGTGSSGVQVPAGAGPPGAVGHGPPAHRPVRHPGPAGAARPETWSRCGRPTTRRSGGAPRCTPGGIPIPSPIRSAEELPAAERTGRLRGGVAARRDLVPRRDVQRRRHQPEANAIVADFVRDQDRRDRPRPGHGGEAEAVDARVGDQASPRRIGLLRDLQPAERQPGRPARRPDRADHAPRDQDPLGRAPARRDRVRHRLRRADRVDRPPERRRAGTASGSRTRGRPGRAPTSG